MNVRWRLGTCAVELLALLFLSHGYDGSFISGKPWYAAAVGLIANALIVEPFFTKPGDVLVNAVAFILIAASTNATLTASAWTVGIYVSVVLIALAAFSLLAGTGRTRGKTAAVADSARQLCKIGSARTVYSAVFLLSALESNSTLDRSFWWLVAGWCVILAIVSLNWQRIWMSGSGRADFCFVEGMIGPSTLFVSGPSIPSVGSSVMLGIDRGSVIGVVTQRLRRKEDLWAAVHTPNADDCESAVAAETLSIAIIRGGAQDTDGMIGVVDAGSTDTRISFLSLKELSVGDLVLAEAKGAPVLYQLSKAEIETIDVRGGSHLAVRASGIQIGRFDASTLRITEFPWVPPPGVRVFAGSKLPPIRVPAIPGSSVLLGHVAGTDIPIYMEVTKALEGHVVILGMTKMGKSTLAERIALELGKTTCVVLLDQTGEWVSKKGFAKCTSAWTGKDIGTTVFEPNPGEIPPDRALSFLEKLVALGRAEYATGHPFPRVAIIDEAHQFVPEPAGLGFNAPGRESAAKIGTLLMQIRKYGICVIMISQRTAVVSKSALSQCENVIAFRSVDKTGLDYLEGILGADACDLLPKLGHATALVSGPAMTCDRPVVIRTIK